MPFPVFPKNSQLFNDKLIHFRLLEKSDAEMLFAFITTNLDRFRAPFPKTTGDIVKGEKETRRWIKNKLLNHKAKSSFILLGLEKDRIVYWGSAFNFEWKVPKCEISYMVDRQWEGKGIAAYGSSLLIRYLWSKCKLNKIVCRIDPRNEKSLLLAQKLHFVREGEMKNDFRNGDDELIDAIYLGLTPA